MKKLFDRIRRWLITKLGGYTERCYLFPTDSIPKIASAEVELVNVVATATVAPEALARLDELDVRRLVADGLMKSLAVQLGKNDLVKITYKEILQTGDREYEARLRVLPWVIPSEKVGGAE